MSLTFVIVSVLVLTSGANAVISGNYNCITYNGTAFVYTPAAVACSNVISDASCQVLYAAPNTLYPASGNDAERAYACYTTATATPAATVNDMVTAAISTCPKTCGFCCQTSAYSCSNIHVLTVTLLPLPNVPQCASSVWRTIIAADCPAACGFCNDGGCVDAVVGCANDISICNTVGMETFVATYCQRTCGKCASSTTTASSASSSTCTSYSADSSTACTSWAANGFCTNTFYTTAVRKSYCATTCKLC